MTDIREQEMQNRIDSLTLEKENLRYEIDIQRGIEYSRQHC